MALSNRYNFCLIHVLFKSLSTAEIYQLTKLLSKANYNFFFYSRLCIARKRFIKFRLCFKSLVCKWRRIIDREIVIKVRLVINRQNQNSCKQLIVIKCYNLSNENWCPFCFLLFWVTSLYPHYCGYIRLIRTLSVIVTHKTKGITIRYFKIFVITFFLYSSSLAQIVSDG